MVDNFHSDGLGNERDGGRRPEKSQPASRPLTDREVPLPQDLGEATRVLAPAVHAWLDGDLPEASVRRGETARDVEFWKMISGEAERRRHARMPVSLESKIMEALPHTLPVPITPWHRREFVITPGKAVAIGAGIAAATAGLMALLLI